MFGDLMKRITIFALIFIIALFPMVALSADAAGDYLVEDGVLLSFTGRTTTVRVPSNIYYIADGAFKGNTRIDKLILHSGVHIIGNEAFYGCTALSEVSGTDGITSVGAYAFYGTPFLDNCDSSTLVLGSVLIGGRGEENLTLDKTVKSVAPYAFADNSLITSLNAVTLTEIGEGAFYRCKSLSSVDVSENLSYVGALAFYSTPFTADYNGDFVTLGDGVLIEYKGDASKVAVPNFVKHIGAGAFYFNSALIEAVLPEGLVSVGIRAFMNCTKLESVSFPESLVMIDREAFAKCKALKSVTLTKGIELLGNSVFYGCNKLESVSYLCSADIPTGAFEKCSALKLVNLKGKPSKIGHCAFSGCSSFTDIGVSDSVKYIADNAFDGADLLTVSCAKDSYAYSACDEQKVNVIQCGDANTDGKINIRDATCIQKYAADIIRLDEIAQIRADANFDGKINVRDATYIQKLLAELL